MQAPFSCLLQSIFCCSNDLLLIFPLPFFLSHRLDRHQAALKRYLKQAAASHDMKGAIMMKRDKRGAVLSLQVDPSEHL